MNKTDLNAHIFAAMLVATVSPGRRRRFDFIRVIVREHTVSMDLCKEINGTQLNCCAISNETSGLCGTVTNHTLPVLLANSAPCTVHKDDPGMLRWVFLTFEIFWKYCRCRI
jgi:hypothetical protein